MGCWWPWRLYWFKSSHLGRDMTGSISHDIRDESLEAKARWFQSLSLEDRMDVFVALTNLILENNPDIVKTKYVRPASERIRVIDLEDVRILESKNVNSTRED